MAMETALGKLNETNQPEEGKNKYGIVSNIVVS